MQPSIVPPPLRPPPSLGGSMLPPQSQNATTSAVERIEEDTELISGGADAATNGVHVPMDARQIALLQLCFDESELTAVGDEFDPAAFVREKCSHVSLQMLCDDLTTYAKDLDARVMQHIHDEVHEAFIAVSAQLVSMQDSLHSVLSPLDDLSHRMTAASGGLAQRKAHVRGLVEEIKEEELTRIYNCRLLELVLAQHTLDQNISQIEEQLQVTKRLEIQRTLPSSAGGDQHVSPEQQQEEESNLSSALSAVTASLMRAATEVQQIATVFSTLAAPKGLEGELKEAHECANESKGRYSELLDETFLLCYHRFLKESVHNTTEPTEVSHAKHLTDILTIYRLLGDEPRWCEMYHQKVVLPLVDSIITWRAADAAKNNATQAKGLLSTLSSRLQTDIFQVLPSLRRALLGGDPQDDFIRSSVVAAADDGNINAGGQGMSSSVSIIGDAIWPAVSDVLTKKMQFLFIAGIPSVFHSNFISANEIVKLMETHCQSLSELVRLRSAPNTVIWARKWNLDVYRTLQFAELRKKLKDAVDKNLQRSSSGEREGFVFETTRIFGEALLWYMNPEVLLFPLASTFIRDTVTLLGQLIEHFVQKATSMADEGSSPSSSSNLDTEASTFCVNASKDLAYLRNTFIPQRWLPLVLHAVEEDPGLSSSFTQIVAIIGQLCNKGQQDLKNAIRQSLVSRCVGALEGFKNIKTFYHLRSRPVPTEADPFALQILTPLEAFREHVLSAHTMPSEELVAMVEESLNVITRKLHEQVKDVVIQGKRVQALADRRSKKKTATSTSGTSGGGTTEGSTNEKETRPSEKEYTDRDKMVVQAYLDVEAYGSRLQHVGLAKESYLPLQDVHKLLLRAQWLLGADMDPPAEIDEEES